MASAAVELEVGVRPKGQASFSTETSITISLACASVDARFPVKVIMGVPIWRAEEIIGTSSRVSPLLEIASRTSSFVTMPRSPWMPSTGCKKSARVPVLVSVATIFLPIKPDLPIPVIITLPFDL
ncbi:MAG: hypothetical protein BWY90_01313 [Deltaproteobacteria bacterium ADurb.BinA014]|nr:MAG: hypothetical protein BWY90_01313 [Deltaproteobacteria bacterium ADurb.BinA014]